MPYKKKVGLLITVFFAFSALFSIAIPTVSQFKSLQHKGYTPLEEVDISVVEVSEYTSDPRFGLGGGCAMAKELNIPWIYNWGHGKDYPNQPEMTCKKNTGIDFFYTIGKTDNQEVYDLEKFKSDYLKDATEVSEYQEYETLIKNMVANPKNEPNALASYLLIPFYAKENPGYYYVVGNEPDLEKTISPAEYAKQFYLINKRLKKYDPNAKISNGGFLSIVPELCNKLKQSDNLDCSNGQYVWISSFREEYKKLYSVYPRLDFWNIHPYIYGLDPEGGVLLQQAKDRVSNFKKYLDSIGEGDKKIWISEFGILRMEGSLAKDKECTSHGCLSPQELEFEFKTVGEKFMIPLINWYKEQPYLERWFWFYGGQTYKWLGLDFVTTIYKIDGQYNSLGINYQSLLRIDTTPPKCGDWTIEPNFFAPNTLYISQKATDAGTGISRVGLYVSSKPNTGSADKGVIPNNYIFTTVTVGEKFLDYQLDTTNLAPGKYTLASNWWDNSGKPNVSTNDSVGGFLGNFVQCRKDYTIAVNTQPAYGYLDASPSGEVAYGWACDNDKPTQPIGVKLTFEEVNTTSGHISHDLGLFTASNERPDLIQNGNNVCSGTTNHGFSVKLSDLTIADGIKNILTDGLGHKIYAIPIEIDSNGVIVKKEPSFLRNSPRVYKYIAPVVTPPATHLECVSNACKAVSGAGANKGGCTTAGATCGTVPLCPGNFVGTACEITMLDLLDILSQIVENKPYNAKYDVAEPKNTGAIDILDLLFILNKI